MARLEHEAGTPLDVGDEARIARPPLLPAAPERDDAELRLDLLARCTDQAFASGHLPEPLDQLVAHVAASPDEGQQARRNPTALAALLSGAECTTAAKVEFKRLLPGGRGLDRAGVSGLQAFVSAAFFTLFIAPAASSFWLVPDAFAWLARLPPTMQLLALALLTPIFLVLGHFILAAAHELARTLSLRPFLRRVEVVIDEKRRRVRYRWVAARQTFAMDPSLHEVMVSLPEDGRRVMLPTSSTRYQQLAPAQRIAAWWAPGRQPSVVLQEAQLRNYCLNGSAAAMSFGWMLLMQATFGTIGAMAVVCLKALAHR